MGDNNAFSKAEEKRDSANNIGRERGSVKGKELFEYGVGGGGE